jgi:hypothetical protein
VVFEAAPTVLVPTESRVVEGEVKGASEGLASMLFCSQGATNKFRAYTQQLPFAPFMVCAERVEQYLVNSQRS